MTNYYNDVQKTSGLSGGGRGVKGFRIPNVKHPIMDVLDLAVLPGTFAKSPFIGIDETWLSNQSMPEGVNLLAADKGRFPGGRFTLRHLNNIVAAGTEAQTLHVHDNDTDASTSNGTPTTCEVVFCDYGSFRQ